MEPLDIPINTIKKQVNQIRYIRKIYKYIYRYRYRYISISRFVVILNSIFIIVKKYCLLKKLDVLELMTKDSSFGL